MTDEFVLYYELTLIKNAFRSGPIDRRGDVANDEWKLQYVERGCGRCFRPNVLDIR